MLKFLPYTKLIKELENKSKIHTNKFSLLAFLRIVVYAPLIEFICVYGIETHTLYFRFFHRYYNECNNV